MASGKPGTGRLLPKLVGGLAAQLLSRNAHVCRKEVRLMIFRFNAAAVFQKAKTL
jgi:hypothetical protein